MNYFDELSITHEQKRPFKVFDCYGNFNHDMNSNPDIL